MLNQLRNKVCNVDYRHSNQTYRIFRLLVYFSQEFSVPNCHLNIYYALKCINMWMNNFRFLSNIGKDYKIFSNNFRIYSQ